MLQLAAGPGGTAPKAQTMGYSVGGKTGTAHKQEGKGYASKKYRSWFVGMAPIDNPRIVVAVMVDEPSAGKYFGGDVAAPVFSEVVQQTLRMMGVQPDLDVKPQIVARRAAPSRRASDGAARACTTRRDAARAGCAARVRRRAAQRQPPGARGRRASSPGRATPPTAARYVPRRARRRRGRLPGRADGVEAFGFDDDAHRRAAAA